MKFYHWIVLLLLSASCSSHKLPVILCSDKASPTEKLAAKELRRYIYLRTGSVPELKIVSKTELLPDRYILVASQQTANLLENSLKNVNDTTKTLRHDDFYLYSTETGLVISGGSDIGLLYGVYHYLQKLNIGFYLYGDVIPDGQVRNIDISGYNKVFRSLSEIRGINPYRDFPVGPDGWDADNNESMSEQLVKMKMSFADLNTSTNNGDYTNKFADIKSTVDFYKHWCFVQFGISIANESAAIFTAIDGKLPSVAEWYSSLKNIKLIETPWEHEQKKYVFVDQFENLLLPVKGKGNLDRYQYWLHRFKFQRTIAQLGCSIFQLSRIIENVNAENDPVRKKNLVTSQAIPVRTEIARLWGEATAHLLECLRMPEEMGILSNLKNHNYPLFIKYDSLMTAIAGPLPLTTLPGREYKDKLRVFIPAVRTIRKNGEDLKLKIVILGWHDPSQSQLYWKPLGASGDYKIIPMKHISGVNYEAWLPAKEIENNDIEYFINVIGKGGSATFPVTAPEMNQTVVIRDEI